MVGDYTPDLLTIDPFLLTIYLHILSTLKFLPPSKLFHCCPMRTDLIGPILILMHNVPLYYDKMYM